MIHSIPNHKTLSLHDNKNTHGSWHVMTPTFQYTQSSYETRMASCQVVNKCTYRSSHQK